MTKEELQKTIDYLKNVVFKMEDRPDHERLQENIDRLKGEIQRLEEKNNVL